jgi:hypothetical protein
MSLVAIRDLTEAQARAWVEGPFAAECGRECALKVWVEDNSCFAAVYVDGEPGEFFCGPDGDLSQAIRDDVARRAVADLIWDCDAGPGGSYVYAALVPGDEPEPVFKRGECGCGDCTWSTEDIDTDFPVGGGWYRSWPCGSMPEGTYCSDCGSLLGPDGWAMLAGRDPKEVKWPETAPTSPDTPANREEDSNG